MSIFKKRNGMIDYIKQKDALSELLRTAHRNKECFDAEGKSLGEGKMPLVSDDCVDSLAAYLVRHGVKVTQK